MKKITLFIAALAIGFSAMAGDYLEVKDGVIEIADPTHYTFYYGAYYEKAPTNFSVPHTGAQLLYTPDLLTDLNGKDNVEIMDLTFRYHNKSFVEIGRVVRIYLQETDATEFAVNEDGVKQFFEFDHLGLAEYYSFDLMNYYSQDREVTFMVNYTGPFYFTPGKSLLVTIVFDALDDDNVVGSIDPVDFYTSLIGGRAMTYANYNTGFLDYVQSGDFPNATAQLGCGTDVDLPYTRISYCYTVAPNVQGDMDGDGEVGISDVSTLIDYLLSGNTDDINMNNADCDHDGEITIADVSALIDYLLNGTW